MKLRTGYYKWEDLALIKFSWIKVEHTYPQNVEGVDYICIKLFYEGREYSINTVTYTSRDVLREIQRDRFVEIRYANQWNENTRSLVGKFYYTYPVDSVSGIREVIELCALETAL